jgi:hypothetical protein
MKTILLFIFLTSFCFASQDTAVVRFANGDIMSGNAVDLNLETLTWQSDLLKDPAQFKISQITELQLPSEFDSKFAEADHEAVLELTNGDSVRGQLIGLNNDEIRLDTWFAGEMVFNKLNVKTINILGNRGVIYRGPFGLEGWKMNGKDGSWKFSNNDIISSSIGSIGRDIDFTDEIKICYDLNFKALSHSRLVFFTSDLNTANPKSGYEFSFLPTNGIVRITRLNDDRVLPFKNMGIAIQPNKIARIDIRVSRKTKRIMVFLDEKMCGVFEDESLNEIHGKGLMFASDTNDDIAISNILVTKWDPFVDEPMNEDLDGNFQINRGFPVPNPPKSKELPEGRMMLSNRDTIEGEVIGIEGEMIKIKTPFTEVTFPVNRINNIALKKANPMPTARLNNGDVKALLADGSSLVFRLDNVKDDKLSGYSDNFGRAEFLQSAFKRIEFNLYPISR